MKNFVLTKTKYVTFLSCPKNVWLSSHKPNIKVPTSAFDTLKLQEGNKVGEYAINSPRFQGGVKVTSLDADIALAKTQELLNNPSIKHIYEAAFKTIYQGLECLVRVDILEKNEDRSLNVIEVKSSTKPKKEYYHDLAFQKWVIEKSGQKVHECFLLHLNKKYIYQDSLDLAAYFTLVNFSNELAEYTSVIESNVLACQNFIKQPENLAISNCELERQCTCSLSKEKTTLDSIENLRALHFKKREQLSDKKVLKMQEISDEWIKDFTANQQIQISCAKNPEHRHIEKEKIKDYLSQLSYPLHYLDFEALLTAIPYFKGMQPQQFVVYQASVHKVSHAAAKPTHSAYLHEDNTDPREHIISFLETALGKSGSIITYHQQFEQTQLEKLQKDFPEHKEMIQGWINRLWDLEKIFSSFWFYDSAQIGSSSIKKVLPVMVPKLSYDKLYIKDGNASVAAFLKFITLDKTSEEFAFLRNKLVEYNSLDTFAMIKILNKIKWLVKKS